MLIISRKRNESILIGEDIKLTNVKIKGNLTHIGIEAPIEVKILRGEIARDQKNLEDRSQDVGGKFSSKPEGHQYRAVNEMTDYVQPMNAVNIGYSDSGSQIPVNYLS